MAPNLLPINFKSGPAQAQLFSFPSDVITHIWQHPSTPEVLEKLYQTCKYFFSKKQIFILPYTDLLNEGILSNIYQENNKTLVECFIKKMNKENGWLNRFFVCKMGKWEDLKLQKQIWFCTELRLTNLNKITLAEKVYRCSIHTWTLGGSEISFQDFCFLTSENTIQNFTMIFGSRIYYFSEETDNADDVQIDAIISKMPKLQKFKMSWIYDNAKVRESLQKLSSLILQSKLKQFELWFSFDSEAFDLTFIYSFLKQNASEDCDIQFWGRSGHENEVLKAAISNLGPVLKEMLPKISGSD